MNHVVITSLPVFIHDGFPALLLREVREQPVGVGLGVKLRPDDFRDEPDGHDSPLVVVMRGQRFQAQNFGTQLTDSRLVGICDLKPAKIGDIELDRAARQTAALPCRRAFCVRGTSRKTS
jgi:hypothetical protein